MPIRKNKTELKHLADWELHAGPRSREQWVDGRSAKEAARAWLGGNGQLPQEVVAALASHQAFGAVSSWEAEPEARPRFDAFSGEPRNSDVVVWAEDRHGPFVIVVEAKADEAFSETVADTFAAALERYLENDRSNGVARIQLLAKAILGPRRSGDPHACDLRYQLLTACAGAVCEAARHGCSRALVLVQEFVTLKTTDANHERNAKDMNQFVKRLSHGIVAEVRAGDIMVPLRLRGCRWTRLLWNFSSAKCLVYSSARSRTPWSTGPAVKWFLFRPTDRRGGGGSLNSNARVQACRGKVSARYRLEICQMMRESNRRWCSDGFEIACDNRERVRVAFALDCCDREAMSWVATTGGITGDLVRDLMVEAIEARFDDVTPEQPIEWLTDNGSPYIARETRRLRGRSAWNR